MVTKSINELTLRDLLSRLTFTQASKLLGEGGQRLIQKGGIYDIDIEEFIEFTEQAFRLIIPQFGYVVTITLSNSKKERIGWFCSNCDVACEHVGAAFSLILEEKMALGLASPPAEAPIAENLTDEELVEQALRERKERGLKEKMSIRSVDSTSPWVDYIVGSKVSGKSYRVALRGEARGQSYCSCPDFRKNTLGTCKHIFHVIEKVRKRFPAAVRSQPYQRKEFCVYLEYGEEVVLRLGIPKKLPKEVASVVKPFENGAVYDAHQIVKCIRSLEKHGVDVTVYPDAEKYLEQQLFTKRIQSLVTDIRKNPAEHPLRTGLLKTELLPYQLDGIAFAVGAGRAILADDMGLGKTIQAIGVAELLAQQRNIQKVLVICPASLKSQWRSEINRFCDRDCQLIIGPAASRAGQYSNSAFFTICNYEQVLRDILTIEQQSWDLIILDEGQRIKNWEAKTSEVVKSLCSPFALVLSGTPLENRLDDLFSIVEFVDDRRLPPAFRFFNRHRIVAESGKVLGYKNLDELREQLKPVFLRRTRETVMRQLPERSMEIVRVAPTEEQLEAHGSQLRIIRSIVCKRFLSEMDLMRLRKALLLCRLIANSTFLMNKQKPGYSSKLERLESLLSELFQEENRKVVLFSEWTTMLDLIEPLIEDRNLEYVRLDGSVPQKKRQELVSRFQSDPKCKLFLATNAGSTGLNLQAANTVINVDLPWNPAILEQRIARAHRMGQKQPVQVFVLVTEQTIEGNLLATISGKHQLALAALDVNSDVTEVQLTSGMEELRRRLEVLLGAKAEAPVDKSIKRAREAELKRFNSEQRISMAGGQLLSAAFNFLGEMIPEGEGSDQSTEFASELREQLNQCVEQDEQGRPKLTVTLPDAAALNSLANSLGRILAGRN